MTVRTTAIGFFALFVLCANAPGAAAMSTETPSDPLPEVGAASVDSAPGGETAAAGASAIPPGTAPVDNIISAIRIDAGSTREERIRFSLNGVLPPEMFFIEGDPIRLVCDFIGVNIGADVPQEIEAGGKLILRVRTGVHASPEPKVRVVVELGRGREYEIDEYFRPQESLYELFIRPAGGIAPAAGD